MIYLAGPLDAAGARDRCYELRVRVFNTAGELGVALFDPGAAYEHAGHDPAGVVRTNQAAIEASDGVLALLPVGVPTVGTPMEVSAALELGKPVVVACNSPGVALRGLPLRIVSETQEGVREALEDLHAAQGLHTVGENGREASVRSEGGELRWAGSGQAPLRHYEDDAGWDLTCDESVDVLPGSFVDIACNIAVQLPAGTWGMITGRSSTLRKRGLLVAQGVIDGGFRGPLFAGVWNLTEEPVFVAKGDRIAQLIPIRIAAGPVRKVDELEPSLRGERGFGSTG